MSDKTDRDSWVWVAREILPRGLDNAADLSCIRWWDRHEGWVPGITSEPGVRYEVLVHPKMALSSHDATTRADIARGVRVYYTVYADGEQEREERPMERPPMFDPFFVGGLQ
jgi:hypothetical protein